MGQKAQHRAMDRDAEKRRSKRAAALTAAGLAAAFASWAYFVLVANPSFHLGVILVGTCGLCLLAAVWEFFDSHRIKALFSLLVIAAGVCACRWADSQWVQKITNDVEKHLDIQLRPPSTGDLWHSLAVVRNNSSWRLRNHHITCDLHALHSGLIIVDSVSLTKTWGDNAPLRIGGDSQSDECLAGWWGTSGPNPISCADLVISVKYTIDSHPEIDGSKQLRFVTDGKDWVQEPVESTAPMCPDMPKPAAPKPSNPKPSPVGTRIHLDGTASAAVSGSQSVPGLSNSQISAGNDNRRISCPNGICANGDINGSPTVINQGPPPAEIVSWSQQPLPAVTEGVYPKNPGVKVTFAVSHGWTNIRVGAQCNVPCTGVSASATRGWIDVGQVTSPVSDRLVALEVGGPTLESDYPVEWEIRSKDGNPVSVLRLWIASKRPQ